MTTNSSAPRPSEAGEIERAAARLENATPQEALAWAYETFPSGVAIATGFGAEGMALLDMAVKIVPAPDVFFVDTEFLFPETYALRRRVEERYGIEIRAVRPVFTPEQQEDAYGPSLWRYDPDLCCELRKLDPLESALRGLDAWITAIRRDQSAARAGAGVVEWDARWKLVKVNPLARWSRGDVWDYLLDNRVPYNPLHDRGYPSVGCTHCTRAVLPGEGERDGRWAGFAKTECGLHTGAKRARSAAACTAAAESRDEAHGEASGPGAAGAPSDTKGGSEA